MTKFLTNPITVTVIFLLLAVTAFVWLITSACGSSGAADFFGDAGAWFTSAGC